MNVFNVKFKYIIILLCFLPLISHAQIITTIAGIGLAGDAGDGGPATLAKLNVPAGMAFDKSGNLIFSDAANECIRKINAMGVIETIAGNGTSGYGGDGGPATDAMLNDPGGIAIDTAGNIYIADLYNLRIRIVYPSGIINTFAGNGISGLSGDGGPATAARISNPGGVAIDKYGNVFFSGGTIRKVSISGTITTVAGNGGFGYSGDGGPATAATLHSPIGLSVDESDNIYFADNENSRIRKVSGLSGIITTIAGSTSVGYTGDGGLATNAFLNYPCDAKVDKFGNVFFTDYGNNVIRKISTTGYISTFAGNNIQGFSGDGGLATSAELYGPYFIGFDSCDNVYVSDGHNNRIREVTMPYCTYLGLGNPNQQKSVKIYPNPTYDLLNIDNLKNQATYYLLNVIGSVVQQGALNEGNNSISIQSIPNGMYMLEMVDEGGEKIVRKVVKE